MKSLLTLLLAFAALFFSANALAARGVVVYIDGGCDYYIVQSKDGFALLELFDGTAPSMDDEIAGDFESYGKKKLFNRTSREGIQAWVVDFWLAQDEVMQMYTEQCRK